MSKNAKEQPRNPASRQAGRSLIPQKYQHTAAIGLLYICLMIFFHSVVFEGKTYQSADTIASHSWDTLLKDSESEGIYPLWNPYIFCGMPGFASLTYSPPRIYDIISTVIDRGRSLLGYLFLEHRTGVWLLFYLIYGIGVYLFAFHKLNNKPISLIVALMATYATYVAILIMIGHLTKIAVLAWFPYIFLLVEKLREKFSFFQAILLTIIVRLMIEPGHVQFIFYIYLALGTYLIFMLIHALLKKKEWKGIVVSGASLVIATVFAFLMGADQHFSTLEYNPYSIRGSNPIVQSSQTAQTKTIEGGLDYDYATSWSFSPGEMMTFFIPSWYGFGPLPYDGPLTGNRPQKLNFYWGPQPFVDGPQYMGIIVIILAIIGFVRNRKDLFVLFMGFAIVVSLLISFGKEFSPVYDLMYRYFPMFNKFRLPLLILMLVQFFMPILAGYGIKSMMPEQKKTLTALQEKRWKYVMVGLLAGALIAVAGKSIIKEIYLLFFPVQEVAGTLSRAYGQLNPTVIGMIYEFVFSTVARDILIAFILLFLVFGAFYYYLKGKLKPPMLYSVIILVVLFDLWRIAWKPSEPVARHENILEMSAPDYVKMLNQDRDLYRALKIRDGQPIYDNSLAYWRVQNAYGYQGAKMRIFQDMADVAGLTNPLVWQLMNVKYIISNREIPDPSLEEVYNGNDAKLYRFRSWLPRLFFVEKCDIADGLTILNRINSISFNPRNVAYIQDSVRPDIDPPKPEAGIKLVKFGSQELESEVTATGNNLLFMSESYYPKGWKAFIDGKETGILRLNYMFRGVVIPAGKHTLKMKFEPESFYLGKNVSLASNIVILIGMAVQGSVYYRKRKQKTDLSAEKGGTTQKN
jgi:hypothetical protein